MVVSTAECLRCGKQFYPRMGEEFCSQAHAREYFGVAARAMEQQSVPPPPYPQSRSTASSASPIATDLSRTGRHRVMRLLNLGPIAPPEDEAVAAVPETPPPVPPPPVPEPEPPFFSKIRKVRFPRNSCSPAPAAICQDTLEALPAAPESVDARPALDPATRVSTVLDSPLEPVLPPFDPPQCFRLPPPAVAADAALSRVRWEDAPAAWVPFHTETERSPALELPPVQDILPAEPTRRRTRRLFHTPGKERLRACNLASYRQVYKESLEPWIIPPRPALPRWVGEPVKFDWARLVARLADFEPQTPTLPTSKFPALDPAAVKDPALSTQPSMMVGANANAKRREVPFIGPLVRFWQTQSWFSRSLALAIPVLAFIALKPSFDGSLSEPVVLAKDMPAPSSTAIRRNPTRERRVVVDSKLPSTTQVTAAAPPPEEVEPKDNPKLNQVDRMLLARAAVELADDFSFGLDSWDSRNGTAWTYDQTGFIRPRSLALYRPSMNLTDYSVQFLGKIDYAAIGWVVRALDFNNYHAVKLVQRGGGPLPRYTIVRYTVVDGKEGPRIEHPLPLNLYKDTLFRIRMDIRGSDYAILVQDSVVDSWSDDRFPFGGVGFFSGRGEESRVRWVQVTYQNDLIGKICAWFAPRV